MTFLRIVISLYFYSWSMIFSENRYPLFGIMLDARPGAGHDIGELHVSRVPVARLAVLSHSAASTFLPSEGCTRVSLKRPSAQTTVKPSASTATTSPILPAMPLGSLAGIGLASKILSALPPSVDQAPGAGLQPRIIRSISCHGLPQSMWALSGPQRPS